MPAARRQFGLELGAPLPQPIAKGDMMHGRGAALLHTVQMMGAGSPCVGTLEDNQTVNDPLYCLPVASARALIPLSILGCMISAPASVGMPSPNALPSPGL